MMRSLNSSGPYGLGSESDFCPPAASRVTWSTTRRVGAAAHSRLGVARPGPPGLGAGCAGGPWAQVLSGGSDGEASYGGWDDDYYYCLVGAAALAAMPMTQRRIGVRRAGAARRAG
eukprot:CAMPEP_0119407768 /NCGR_PEP_ID=MMETSP1335-20130426/1556_1 /TAXON_ID=259385 /ORGANISM="Chrysoculter rhomboideus, Strain RCC1486" /LENGTH=115 /DNA_ID=CAMNT_0007431925 /DNA_START=242 /DNA_END=585 /DNA_ORIENTATION=+